MKNDNGFTMIELMITVALMSIVMSVGLPSFQSIINDVRLTSTANDMLGAYQLARSAAIKNHVSVYVVDITDASNTSNDKQWKIMYMTNPTKDSPSHEEIIGKIETKKITIDTTSLSGGFSGFNASGRPVNSNGDAIASMCEAKDGQSSVPCKIIFTSNSGGTRYLTFFSSGRMKVLQD